MAPAPHLLYVNSRPTLVSAETWKKYYIEEHLADLVNTGTSKTAALYEEIDLPARHSTPNLRKFLAIYQTDFAEPLTTANAGKLTWTSKILSEGGKFTDVGLEHIDPDTRNYELTQIHENSVAGESAAPELITVEMQPVDMDDCDKWYREELLTSLHEVPGYRRTLRYKKGPAVPFSKVDEVPAFLAVHEMNDAVKALESEQWTGANGTSWSKKVAADCAVLNVRGWRLVYAHSVS